MKKIVILLLACTMFLFANVAKVVAMSGDISVLRESNSISLSVGDKLFKNDIIQTKDNTKVQIIFKDETIVTIGKNSEFKINDYLFDEVNEKYNANFGLIKGTFRTITGKIGKIAPEKFKLNSKSSSIGIRGTQILSNVQIEGDTIFCTEGQIEIVSLLTGETITLQAGQFVEIQEGKPAIIQEFDTESINVADSSTKFLSSEEKEEALESFGVQINQLDSEPLPQNNTSDVPNDIYSEINDSSTYDDLEDLTNDKEVKKTMATFSVLSTGFSSPSLSSKTNGELLFKEELFEIQLKLDNILSNYYGGHEHYYDGSVTTSDTSLNISSSLYSSRPNTDQGYDSTDDLQWGMWEARVMNEHTYGDYENLSGYWLIGEQTSISEVQNLISTATIANYNGYALGKTSFDNSFDASNSIVTFQMDFGNSSLTGNITLNTSDYQINNENISGTLTSSGFTFTPDNAGYGGTGNGKFYGKNANSVGGNFNLTSGSISYTGVFKAKKE